MVRRSVVDLIPFDSEVTNIEDRLWAKEAIKRGYKLVYEPDASVFHYHGIHQSADPARARDVVCIMESRDTLDEEVGGTEQLDLNIVAIITAKGDPVTFCGRPLIEYTMQRAKESAFLKKIIVSTDSEKTRRLAAGAGINAPFLRPPEFSRPGVGVEEVLKYSLAQIEENGEFPDAVVYLSIMQPFRPIILIDELISLFLKKGFDSVMAGYPVYKPCWIEKEGRLNRVDEGFMPRDEKNPVHVGYAGLACVTYPEFLMQGKLLGDNVGIFEVLDHYSTIDVKSPSTFELAEKVFLRWWNSQNKTCRDGGRSAEKGVRTSK
jgi:CMP-N-acetylneuraminic acid synthetase